MVLAGIMSDRPRPNLRASCRRNLTAEFDAVAVDAGLPIEPPEIAENRENMFVENMLNTSADTFKARWGYDTREDRPVEGSNWEWVAIERDVDAAPRREVEVAVNLPREGDDNHEEAAQEVGVPLEREGVNQEQEEEGGEEGSAN